MPLKRLVVLALAGLLALPAAAQDRGAGQAAVYDPQPPAGSAFVRFVNALGTEVALRPDFLPAQRLGTAPDQRVTAYAVVERVAGRVLTLEAGARQQAGRVTLRAEPGSFVTIILHAAADGAVTGSPVVDQTEFNRARARLSFYNAAPGCAAASLGLEPDGPTVFNQVAPATAKSRSVNPVVARLRAECDGRPAPSFALEGLEAGGMYSIWLMRPAGNPPFAFVSRDTTARWTP
jgi:hypothetical protein